MRHDSKRGCVGPSVTFSSAGRDKTASGYCHVCKLVTVKTERIKQSSKIGDDIDTANIATFLRVLIIPLFQEDGFIIVNVIPFHDHVKLFR